MPRRLRQHNGEISGGAKRTSKKGPWTIVAIFGFFPTEKMALQFEWRIHHPPPLYKSKRLRSNTAKVSNKRRKYRYRGGYGVSGRIKTISTVIELPHWTSNSPPSQDVKLICLWYEHYSLNLRKATNCTELYCV